MKNVAFCTLGCKVNQYETDLMEKQLKDAGYNIVDFEKDKADIYIINTCSVTNLATRKSRQMLSKAKNKNESAIVVACGCYSQQLGNENSISKITNLVNIIVGNEEKKDIVNILNLYLDGNRKSNCVLKLKDISKVKKYVQKESLEKIKNIRQSIKIEDGCNNFCSYCIIPYTRGRVRSRDINDIVNEVNILAKNGVKEVVVVGIEIASYGKDLENNFTLINVIENINEIEGIERIRLGSIEPRWLTDENIERMSKVKKLCNHFHLSVQSLSDSVLKRMNRKYTSSFVMERIDKLRKYFENPGITCDIIVGFVDETKEEFIETYNNAKKIGFSDMHIFKYSKRDGTVAANMKNSVSGEEMTDRSEKLIKLSEIMKKEYMSKFIGKSLKVLIEEVKNDWVYGYTTNYIKVRGKGDIELWGKVQDLEFCSIEENILIGKMEQN